MRGINLPSSHDNVPGLFHSDRTSAFRWQTQMSSFVISPQSIRYCTVPLNQTHRIIMLDTTTSSVPADRHLGRTGPRVFPIALGCMGMSGMYGSTDDAESIRAIHAAIDGGITLIDTGDFYGMGHNELLLARALSELPSSTRDKVLLSVKFGAMRTPSGAWSGFDGRPAAVKNYLAYSLKRLGVAHIAIYRPARVDDQIPIEDTIGAVADMIKQGFVQYAALSEAGVETARRAQIVTPIVDVQLEYGITTRGMEAKVLPGLRIWASVSPPTASFPAASSPAPAPPRSPISAASFPASPVPPARPTASSSPPSTPSPPSTASPSRSSPSPGPSTAATTSSRSSAPAP